MSVYSVRLAGVGRGYAITEDNQKLIMTGNRTFYKGETAWTDGVYIYGMEHKHGGTLLASSPSYFPFLSDNRCLCRMNSKGACKTMLPVNGAWDCFVAGKKASYLLTIYSPDKRYMNINTGEVFYLPRAKDISGFIDATVDDKGCLISAWATYSYSDYHGACVLIFRNGVVIDTVYPPSMMYKGRDVWASPFIGVVSKNGRFQGLFKMDSYTVSYNHSNWTGAVPSFEVLDWDVYAKFSTEQRPDGSWVSFYGHTSTYGPHSRGSSLAGYSVGMMGEEAKIYPFKDVCLTYGRSENLYNQNSIRLVDSNGRNQAVYEEFFRGISYGVDLDVKEEGKVYTGPSGTKYNVRIYHTTRDSSDAVSLFFEEKYKDFIIAEFTPKNDTSHPWYTAVAVRKYELPSVAKDSYDFVGSNSTPFDIYVGRNADVRVNYGINATGVQGGGSVNHEITTRVKNCTLSDSVNEIIYNDHIWWVTDVCKNFILTPNGVYKANEQQCPLVTGEYRSYNENTRLVEMPMLEINKLAKKINNN